MEAGNWITVRELLMTSAHNGFLSREELETKHGVYTETYSIVHFFDYLLAINNSRWI